MNTITLPGIDHPVYTLGDTTALTDGSELLAITGARASTGYGNHIAQQIAEDATQRGLTTITTGAYGIAAAATRAALAAGGQPIVWLSGGLDRPYPAGHNGLFDAVLKAGGALLSLQPPGQAPTRASFLATSEAIARTATATIVVEAGPRSGSITLANAALEAGRRLAAVPGPITSAASAGSNNLLNNPQCLAYTGADTLHTLTSAPRKP